MWQKTKRNVLFTEIQNILRIFRMIYVSQKSLKFNNNSDMSLFYKDTKICYMNVGFLEVNFDISG